MTDSQPELDGVFLPLDMRVRVRLNGAVVKKLGWDTQKEDFNCHALMRGPEELLCVPDFLKAEDGGEHPLVRILEKIKSFEGAAPTDFAGVPDLDALSLQHRYRRFDAKWHAPRNVQLDIVIGAEFVRRLSLGNPPTLAKPRAFYIVHAGMLILASERRGEEAFKADARLLV